MKTTVINGTKRTLTLKEGTAGIFTILKELQPEESYQIVLATYHEYWCGVEADDLDSGVLLSSDDCEDLKQVTINETGTGTNTSYSYVRVNRESRDTPTLGAKSLEETSNCESETTKQEGPLKRLLSIFRKPEKGSSSRSQV